MNSGNEHVRQNALLRHTAEILFSAVYLTMAAILNLQFLDGSNINTIIAGHDEYIAVREVYSLVNPVSWKHFLLAFIAGDVIYYGRIMFYMDALFAFIPFKIWGVAGMVYTVRMLHSVYLVTALVILSNVFLREKYQKALFLIGSGVVYYSLYFLMMPKPEPLQLLVFSIFLYYFKNRNWSFGIHFILLGIAFGLKFNFLVVLPLAFLSPFFRKGQAFRETVIPAIKSFGYFLLGLLIAIPCLLLSPLKPVYLKTYIHETFRGTGKSYDNADITVFDWLKDGFGGYYSGHWILGYVLLALVFVITYFQLRKFRYNHDISVLFLLASGLALTFSIMVTTKRIWPHYIWTGYVLMLLGIIVFASQQTSLKSRRIYFSLISFLMAVTLVFFVKRDLPVYAALERAPEIVADKQQTRAALQYIKTRYPGARVAADESLQYLFSDFVKANPYHPFSTELPLSGETTIVWYGDHPEDIWSQKNDLVVLYKNNPSKGFRRPMDAAVSERLKKLYSEQVGTNYTRDTVLGKVEIFRRAAK